MDDLPAGTVARSSITETNVTFVEAAPLKRTSVTTLNPVPKSVTSDPTGALPGENQGFLKAATKPKR